MSEKELLGEYRLVIGLEIHMHVNTPLKMFSRVSSDIYNSEPNTRVSPVCLGLPGALPVPNFDAVQKTQMLGLALNCRINKNSKFDRKHYFYPDLPKGYQISQYKEPLCEGGLLVLENGFRVEIERIHLEEDTARSYHENGKTLIDFNKSGMALMELVTKPVFTSVYDASEFARELRNIARYLGISNADMEKGQLRIEPNISLRTKEMEESKQLPTYKVEVKNINSFKYMEKAVISEIKRQRALLESGKDVPQENRGYDETSDTTVAQRSKEEAHDYRYFPEPDIPPMVFDEEYINSLRAIMPELPRAAKERLISQYNLSTIAAEELTKSENMILKEKFEEIVLENIEPTKVANLLLNKKDYRELSVKDFITKLNEESSKIDDNEELIAIIKTVLRENTEIVASYKSGKESTGKYLLGQVMRASKGKADAQIAAKLLEEQLKN